MSNVRVLGWRAHCDGTDNEYCKNVAIDGYFWRTSDDSIAISIHNADRAVIKDVHIENVRVEDTDELLDFYVGLSIYSDDCPFPYSRNNPKRIGIPGTNQDPSATNNKKQWFVPSVEERATFTTNRGSIESVVVRGLNALTAPHGGSIISGYDPDHTVRKIAISGLVIDGRSMSSVKVANMTIKDVRDLSFRPVTGPKR